jgi:serine/threonine-protein kinase
MESSHRTFHSVCPDRDTLLAFSRGRLPDYPLETIAEHVSSCPRCASVLEELQADDAVLSRLRRRSAAAPVVDEAVCARLAEQARAIGEAEPIPATVSGDSATKEVKGLPLPATFGRYLLLERLGLGGMGVVYKARQEALKLVVAVKMIRAGNYASEEERRRFQREGQAIARIRHAHVVRIHEFDEHEGQLYFSMELLEGGTLADRLHNGVLPEREAAELVRTLAQAVAAAHAQEVVHRDLKPGNVLFTADGTVKITDFGLAKVLDAGTSETVSDAILGTPAYMSPEQASGEGRKIGPTTDVYALGVMLYEALTGSPPLKAKSRLRTLELVRTREPEPPSRKRPGLSRDLEAICLKCLEKEPVQRYPSAASRAEDLDNWLRGEPTKVRPPGWRIRLWRRLRRHPQLAIAATLLLFAAVALPAGLWYRDPERPRRVIESELARGRSQTLIGETGPPAWSNWCMGKETSVASTSRNEPFSIHTSNLALLALVRDPRCNRFKLRAEVRHERTEIAGEVGIFVAHQLYASQRGPVHCFIPLAFNDINDEGQRPEPLPPNVRWMRQKNRVSLQPRLFWEESRWAEWEYRFSGPGPELFRASRALGEATKWYPLTLNVDPERVQGFWKDTSVGELSPSEFVAEARQALDTKRKSEPEESRFLGFEPAFLPRGALGLYVMYGSASFRRVVIEPLDSSD